VVAPAGEEQEDAMNDDEALAELTRLRALEAAVREAGQLTMDGVFVVDGDDVWHPKHSGQGCVDLNEGAAEFVDAHFYHVSECYSSPEASQAAAKAGGAR
jgi:hypothetical protein